MNAEEFYEQFKEALRYHDVEWGNKKAMSVRALRAGVVFMRGDKSILINVNEECDHDWIKTVYPYQECAKCPEIRKVIER